MELDGVVDANLEAMSEGPCYARWQYEVMAPFLGRRILEAGGGIGTLTRHLFGRERLVTVELRPDYVQKLREEFGSRPQVRVERMDLSDPMALRALHNERLDTILCANVLEHIEDDRGVLRSFHEVLQPGGRAVILVPHGPWLHGSLDGAQGHFRRYGVEELRGKLETAGFRVEAMLTMNRAASLGWFVNGTLMGRTTVDVRQVRIFDSLSGLFRFLEPVLPFPPLSVIGVGRRTEDA